MSRRREGSDDEPEGDAEGENPEDLDGAEGDPSDGEGAQGGDPAGMGEEAGNITPAQASRMLDGVEEGRQRVKLVGRPSDKPW